MLSWMKRKPEKDDDLPPVWVKNKNDHDNDEEALLINPSLPDALSGGDTGEELIAFLQTTANIGNPANIANAVLEDDEITVGRVDEEAPANTSLETNTPSPQQPSHASSDEYCGEFINCSTAACACGAGCIGACAMVGLILGEIIAYYVLLPYAKNEQNPERALTLEFIMAIVPIVLMCITASFVLLPWVNNTCENKVKPWEAQRKNAGLSHSACDWVASFFKPEVKKENPVKVTGADNLGEENETAVNTQTQLRPG